MSYNDYMYAIDRSDEYLAHYGVKGMKWGVRKAIESGNSRRLDRAYRKAAKKLARLEKRANSGAKYARRAAALGAGAAAAGGLAALGTKGVSNMIGTAGAAAMKASKPVGKAMRNVGGTLARTNIPGVKNVGARMMGSGRILERTGGKVGGKVQRTFAGASKAVYDWGNKTAVNLATNKSNSLANRANAWIEKGAQQVSSGNLRGAAKSAAKANSRLRASEAAKLGITNNAIARAGAAALGAGLAGAAGYNAYRAATTKRAANQAQQWKSEMNKAFAGTKYANGGSNRSRNRRRKNRG